MEFYLFFIQIGHDADYTNIPKMQSHYIIGLMLQFLIRSK